MSHRKFRACPRCGASWSSRDEFTSDVNISLVEYIADFQELDAGIFVFSHRTCNATIEVLAKPFLDLCKGPHYTSNKIGTDDCPGYCLYAKVLLPCTEPCQFSGIRKLLPVLKKHGCELAGALT